MAKEFLVRKGMLKPVELKGLRSHYIVTAGGGVLLGMIICFVISIAVGLVVIISSLVVSIYMNNRYGVNGLSELLAMRGCADYVFSNRRLRKMIRKNGKREGR